MEDGVERERLEEPLDHLKGLSPAVDGRRLGELVEKRVSLFGGAFVPPVMVLKRSALDHNIETMARYCRDNGVDLAPHGKTTMAPQRLARQRAAGAWGITAATAAHVAVYREAGIRRIILANELADPGAIDWLLEQLAVDPEFDLLCYVDSVAGVGLLAEGLARRPIGRPFDVLLEMGYANGRTGCRTVEQARGVGLAAAGVEGLRVVGLAGFEGLIGGDLSAETFAKVDAFLELMRSTAEQFGHEGLLADRGGGVILSAGGSIHFDRVVAAFRSPLETAAVHSVIRSGCYVTHDSGHYERMSPFSRPGADPRYSLRPALEAWGEVLSTPEHGLAIVSLGRRDVPVDLGMPVARRLRRRDADKLENAAGLSFRSVNDQHGFVGVPEGMRVGVGDWLSFGISHPCTAFDKWRLLPEVDDDYRVVDLVRTYF
jgi:D-serine deaminase-like pyridoxal phosphate-dependent protein